MDELPGVVNQLAAAAASSATAGGAAKSPHTSGAPGGGSGPVALEDEGRAEAAARAFLLRLLRCRVDFNDPLGREAPWVKELFPEEMSEDGPLPPPHYDAK